ncbi:hypothetical protein STA1M1_37060 [Sinisalibacter aestuarii]|uniref:Uncharacterized protein n=1 Tax=Sinisalibacter aestuarii TaxID=2949426 RepID=A0ABQ5LXY5_9RHOB|nr:hypothetical protein [Sinisalibacter aestuarii]GKY89837.1 hypothetical protein STA1M1_37060 [Sinisalibacter aestuarii]
MDARQAEIIRAVPHREPCLSGQDDLIGIGRVVGQPPADDLLGEALTVDIRGINEIAARRDVVAHELSRRRFVGLVPEGHGAKGKMRYDGAAVAEFAILHGVFLPIR